jgi:hypothetical protein
MCCCNNIASAVFSQGNAPEWWEGQLLCGVGLRWPGDSIYVWQIIIISTGLEVSGWDI